MEQINIQILDEDNEYPLSNTEVLNVLTYRAKKHEKDANAPFLKIKRYLEQICPEKKLTDKIRNLKYSGNFDADIKTIISYCNTLDESLLSKKDIDRLKQ